MQAQIHHKGTANTLQAALTLHKIGVVHHLDRRSCIIYTINEAVLHSAPGELFPGSNEQCTSLGLFPVIHAGYAGVFFFVLRDPAPERCTKLRDSQSGIGCPPKSGPISMRKTEVVGVPRKVVQFQ